MSDVCSGHGSQRQSGAPSSTAFTVAGLIAWLSGSPYSWVLNVAGWIGALFYDLDDLCVGIRPDQPTITAADGVALVAPLGDPLSHVTAVAKFDQLFRYLLWTENCECLVVSTPGPATPQSEPTDWIAPDPNGTSSGPCDTIHFDPDGTTHRIVASSGSGAADILASNEFPPGTTSLHIAFTSAHVSPTAGFTGTYLWKITAGTGGTTLQTASYVVTTDGSVEFDMAVPTGGTRLYFGYNQIVGNSNGNDVEFTVSMYCGGQSPTSVCCVDPNSSAQLAAILSVVTQLQRYVVPFALVDGFHHVVSGQGEFDLGPVVGIRVESGSTLPSAIGVEDGHPDELFDFGKISWGDGSGFKSSERITTLPFESAPFQASRFTKVGYVLAPGVTVDMVEMNAES